MEAAEEAVIEEDEEGVPDRGKVEEDGVEGEEDGVKVEEDVDREGELDGVEAVLGGEEEATTTMLQMILNLHNVEFIFINTCNYQYYYNYTFTL